jgi:hypothetical protein
LPIGRGGGQNERPLRGQSPCFHAFL